MNILMTTIFDIPHEGGLSTHVLTLKNGLEELGHNVDILSFSSMNPILKKIYAQAPGYLLNKIQKGKGQVINDGQRKKMLKSILKKTKKRYDVIHCHDVYAALAAVETNMPTVATVHGYFSYEAISRGAILKDSKEDQYIQLIEKEAYEKADHLIAVDTRIQQYIFDKTNKKATVIKNFINTNEFKPQLYHKQEVRKRLGLPENRKILFVPRRLTEKNGVIYPTLALPNVLEIFPETLLVYAGTGEQMENISAKVQQLQLEDHVQLLGSVPHDQMMQLYSAADVVLIPSVHSYGVEEATSISALEAMGSGSPVIASAVGGLKEIINDQKDGLLVEEKNPEELSAAIIKLLKDPQLSQNLAKHAREKIEREYSHIEAAKKVSEIYNQVQLKKIC
ncbi:glycosyltransferase family 4 protein [Aeribacillus sp. FSL K6-2833]|uniref:glycosyltransferase family 4 protein n=1 Tax=Aeribacillus sp. FSL K6-2833 TaxID=2954611 RepID=UPI0030D7B34E